MSEPQAPVETAGNALRALQGQSLEVNAPFEQVGRLAEAIKNGGGGGGGYDDSELRRRIEALEKPQTFIATYHGSTAQEIVAFLRNNPHAPIVVQNEDDFYSTIFSKILADNKVVLRTIASLQGQFNLFEYTVTDTAWNATTTPLYYDDAEVREWIDILKTQSLTVSIDNIEVPAAVAGVGGRVNVQGDIVNLPEGYEVKALRSYSVSRASNAPSGDVSWRQANFNMIGTTGNGTKGNIGVLNNSSKPILVKLSLQFACGKIYPQAGA